MTDAPERTQGSVPFDGRGKITSTPNEDTTAGAPERTQQIRKRLEAVEAGPRPFNRTGLIEDVRWLLDRIAALEQERDTPTPERLSERVRAFIQVVAKPSQKVSLEEIAAEVAALEQERDEYKNSLIKASKQMHEHLDEIDRLREAAQELYDENAKLHKCLTDFYRNENEAYRAEQEGP